MDRGTLILGNPHMVYVMDGAIPSWHELWAIVSMVPPQYSNEFIYSEIILDLLVGSCLHIIYIYIYMYNCIWCIYIYIYNMYTCIYVSMYVCMYACMYVCMYVCVYIYTYRNVYNN